MIKLDKFGFLFLAMSAFVLLILHTSCIKEEFSETEDPNFPDPLELISSAVSGIVLDENGDGIGNASIRVRSAHQFLVAETTSDGTFFIPDFLNRGELAVLEVEAAGKFNTLKEIDLERQCVANERVIMPDRKSSLAFHASDGGNFQVQEGVKISIPSDAFASYNGLVELYLYWTSPEDPLFYQSELGGRTAVSREGKLINLFSSGILIAEFVNPGGELLELSEKVTVSLPAHADPVGTANQLSLYHFNPQGAKWVEMSDGIVYDGGAYEVKLPQQGMWNIALPAGEPVSLSGNLGFTSHNGPMSGVVELVFPDLGNYKLQTRTTLDGVFNFRRLPTMKDFTLIVRDLCGNTVYESQVGPLTESLHMGTIDLPVSNSEVLQLDFGYCRSQDMPEYGIIRFLPDGKNPVIVPFDRNKKEYRIPVCDSWRNTSFQILNAEGTVLSREVELDLQQSELAVEDVFECFNPALELEVHYQFFNAATGELEISDSLTLFNPEDQLISVIEVDGNNELTYVALSGIGECLAFDLEIEYTLPVRTVLEKLDFICLNMDYEIDPEKANLTQQDPIYTGGVFELEINIFDLEDKLTGEKYNVLVDLRMDPGR